MYEKTYNTGKKEKMRKTKTIIHTTMRYRLCMCDTKVVYFYNKCPHSKQ